VIDQRIGKIKVRRGTDSQRITNVFEEGEVIYSVDKRRIFVGDDVTLGGVPVSNRNYIIESLGNPPTLPVNILEGDIIFDKEYSSTYIVDWNGSEYELLLIGDGNCCVRLKNQIDDLYTKLRTMTGCLYEPPLPPKPPSKLTWDIQPSDYSVNLNDTVTFSSSAVGNGNITYQWRRKDGLVINSSNVYQRNITISNVGIPDIATYYCVASNSIDSITSREAVLSIGSNSILAEDGTYILSELQEFIDWESNASYLPVITKQPVSITTAVGNTVNFSVESTGTAPLTYQWKVNGFDIFGETKSSYKITNASANKTGITCVVSNPAGDVGSNSVNLLVGTPPVITKQPTSQSVNKGLSVSMSVEATGGLPFTFQWSKNGTIISSATSDTLTINPVDLIDAGSYTCTVSNIFDSAVSNAATLTVINNFNPGDIIISADTNNFVLKDVLITKGWDTSLPVKVNVIVNSGVTVGSNSSSLPSFTIDNFPVNSEINLTNNGTIQGAGGDGGIAGFGSRISGSNGKNGGDSLKVLNSVNITNNGSIWSGGGGGGGPRGLDGKIIPNGGGGAGTIAGIPDGTKLLGGIGKTYELKFGSIPVFIFKGGDGGNPGQNGKAAYFDQAPANPGESDGIGGLAGYYIDGNSFVTWIKKGDVLGNVK
jgi:hypothetical protein